jgi:hypothetical protein
MILDLRKPNSEFSHLYWNTTIVCLFLAKTTTIENNWAIEESNTIQIIHDNKHLYLPFHLSKWEILGFPSNSELQDWKSILMFKVQMIKYFFSFLGFFYQSVNQKKIHKIIHLINKIYIILSDILFARKYISSLYQELELPTSN